MPDTPVPRSALGKRTEAQYWFDLGVKGWAFMSPEALSRSLPRYEELATPLARDDARRETLGIIRDIVASQSEN